MYAFLISFSLALAVWCGLFFSDVLGYGWSTFWATLAFVVSQVLIGRHFQKKLKAGMGEVQGIMLAGQKRLQAKVQRWQVNPPGSMQAAQAEMMRDTKVFVKDALAATETLRRYQGWVPLMKRQIATAQLQLHWMVKEFDEVDRLMPQALTIDPTIASMKMARMQMKNEPIAEIEKLYRKTVRRLRYNQNVVPAALYSWILVKRGDVDGAFKALTEALKNSDDSVLRQNHEHLMNNRVNNFSNANLGDKWYTLMLEEPRMSRPRSRMHWR